MKQTEGSVVKQASVVQDDDNYSEDPDQAAPADATVEKKKTESVVDEAPEASPDHK